MRAGLAVSVIGHLAILAWGVFSLPSAKPFDATLIEAVPVDFVPMDEVTHIDQGIRTAAIAPQSAPKPAEVPKPAPPPPPKPAEPPKPVKAPDPTPPMPPTPPTPAPPQPAPTPPAPKPEPKPEPAPAPQPEPPPPDTAPPPDSPPPDKAASPAPPVPMPHPRPQPPTPAVAVAVASTDPAKTPKDFDTDTIAALLDKDEPAPAPAPPTPTPPALGAPSGAVTEKMTVNELDALRARMVQCWSPPIGWTDPAEVRVVVKFALNIDGTLAAEPEVTEAPTGRYAQIAPESAVRAVRKCAPYSLPPDKYHDWQEVEFTFDPKDMAGG